MSSLPFVLYAVSVEVQVKGLEDLLMFSVVLPLALQLVVVLAVKGILESYLARQASSDNVLSSFPFSAVLCSLFQTLPLTLS